MMVENQGNAQASCRMHLVDPTGRLDGDFDPPAVGVEPGGNALVRLKLRAGRRQWDRRSRSIPFRVEADQQGTPTAEARGTFIQAPMVPERLWARLAWTVVAAGAVAGVWFGAVLPAIDDAVTRAVADVEPVAAVPTTTVVVETSTTTTVAGAPAPAPAGDLGEPFSRSLTSGATEGNTSSRNIPPVAADRALDITDLIVDNPFGDEGIATVRVGLTTFDIDLREIAGFDWKRQFFTPLRLGAGEQVVFDVSCSRPGRPAATTCSTTLTVSGRLVDLDA
jgi:hypothetical protein